MTKPSTRKSPTSKPGASRAESARKSRKQDTGLSFPPAIDEAGTMREMTVPADQQRFHDLGGEIYTRVM